MDNFNTSSFDIYKDISARTKGEIYLGVIGAVRKINVYQTFYGTDGTSLYERRA